MVRNVFAEFDADEDQKLRFDEFAELCEMRSSVQLRGGDVQELFNTYDCTQSAAASSDDTLAVGEWLQVYTQSVVACDSGRSCLKD